MWGSACHAHHLPLARALSQIIGAPMAAARSCRAYATRLAHLGTSGMQRCLHMLLSQDIPAGSLCWAAANKPRTLTKAINFGTQAETCCANWCAVARPQPPHEERPDMRALPSPQQSTSGPRQRCCASWCPAHPWPPRGPGVRPPQSAGTLGPGSGPGCLPQTYAHAGFA